jgi:hypothetical protein
VVVAASSSALLLGGMVGDFKDAQEHPLGLEGLLVELD